MGSGITQEEREDLLDNLFTSSNENEFDTPEGVLETPALVIDLNNVNSEARRQANIITEKLSNYYFDEKYIDNHPYIPAKIAQEMDNIRRLIKMLAINEAAQDVLIQSISMNAGKGTLYQNLTSLQSSMINIQTQLNKLTEDLEKIFKEMQAECEKTFEEKPKEVSGADGTITVRGSKEFIQMINAQLYGDKPQQLPEQKQETPSEETQDNEEIEGEATYADIVAV